MLTIDITPLREKRTALIRALEFPCWPMRSGEAYALVERNNKRRAEIARLDRMIVKAITGGV